MLYYLTRLKRPKKNCNAAYAELSNEECVLRINREWSKLINWPDHMLSHCLALGSIMIRRTRSSGLHLDHARLDYYFMFIIRKSACFERTRQSLGNQLAAAGFLPGQATMMLAQILTCISLFSTNSLFEKPVPQMQSLTCTRHFD